MSNFKIGGLASGMDTQSIVEQLMKVERLPIDKMKQKKQVIEWQRDQYRDINLKLQEFRRYLSDNFARKATLNAKTVSSSNASRVTATARADAGDTSYIISKVSQLATAASNVSKETISDGAKKIDPNGSIFGHTVKTSETLNADGSGNVFNLKISNISNVSSIEYNGKTYKATGDWENTGSGKVLTLESSDDPGTKIGVNESGQVTFDSGSNPNGKIKVNYEYRTSLFPAITSTENKSETIRVSSDAKDFKLEKTGLAGEITIKVGEDEYKSNGDLQFVDGKAVLTSATNPSKKVTVYEDGRLGFNENIGKDPEDNEKYLNIKVDYSYKQGSFKINTFDKNGQLVENEFKFDGSMTLNQILNQVNGSRAGVNMFYDAHTDKVAVTRKETGDFNKDGKEIQFEGDFLTSMLKLDSTKEQGGANAKFVINGLETERTSNTFNINGVDFTLKETFTDDNAAVTIGITTNVDEVVDKVKEFITKYNDLIDLINGKLTEEKFRSFQPLTEDQRASMSEKEIELWEEKAKSGLLRNDSIISNGLSRIRQALYEQVQGVTSQLGLKSLTEIGIVTSKNYMDGGKLELDTSYTGTDRLNGEERLRKVIAQDPDGFYQMFMAGTIDGPQNEQGIARRVMGIIDKTIKENIEQRAGNEFRQNHQFSLGRELNDINDKISNFERRLSQVESRYWTKFNAMEKAISQLNSQSDTLFSQLMSANGNGKK